MSFNIKCKICGEERKVYPSQRNVKYCGRDCYSKDMRNVACNRVGRTKKKTQEQFEKEVNEFLSGEYTVIGEYKNNRTKVEAIHSVCGEKVMLSPKDVLRGHGCFYCGQVKSGLKRRMSPDEFSFKFNSKVGSKYKQVTEYVSNAEKIKVIHRMCGREFSATPHNLLAGSGCPLCRQSRGEEKIDNFLHTLSVKFEREVSLKDCYYKGKLRFDFSIPYGYENHLLIEFDGIQHFEPIDVFGGEKGLQETEKRDKIKDEYCRDNGIRLLRIPYNFTDEEIYDSILKALSECFFILPNTRIPSQAT